MKGVKEMIAGIGRGEASLWSRRAGDCEAKHYKNDETTNSSNDEMVQLTITPI